MGKGGLVWNFLCAFIDSFVYDSGGAGITEIKIFIWTKTAAPHWGLHWQGGAMGKYTDTQMFT